MRRGIAAITLALFMAVFVEGCVHHHIPPGQIKKQTAPGQMKKHR